jgi:conserved hypothetical protein|nr:MAG TPA: endonuclease-like protein [Caudoviricetes sp.]
MTSITKDEIKQLRGPQFREAWMMKHHPETHDTISKIDAPSWQEKVYMYLGGENKGCKICGKPTKFVNALIGYREYCGRKCCNADPDKKETIKATNIRKYGAVTPAGNRKVKEKIRNTLMDHNPEPKPKKYTYRPPKNLAKLKRDIMAKYEDMVMVPDNFDMKSMVCGWLDEWGIEYNTQEDIHIPSKKMVIACNGCYNHSTIFKSPKYHLTKFKKYEAKGIQIIQIWEDWMVRTPGIVKSFIQAKVGACHEVIYARKCKIVDVKGKIATQFYNQNHIQGRCNASHHIGLEYDGVLVACMSFAKRSKLSGSKTLIDGEWELIRFCNLRGHRVVGGAGRLLKFFITQFEPTIITSYSANDISDGQLYKALGFEKFNDGQTSYWYVEHGTFHRYHRSTFTKAGIVRHGWKEQVDNTWTERQVMETKPFYRIYDAGTTGWRLMVR